MIQFRTAKPPEMPVLRVEPFRGLNLGLNPAQIDDSQSSEMLNVLADEKGALVKRTGYERIFPSSLGNGQINGLYKFKKINGTVYYLIAHGTKLYKRNGDQQPTELFSGLANAKVNFFTTNDLCYIMDGTNYLVFNGTTVSHVVPYVPTLTMSGNLGTGGGVLLEDFNLLGNAFKETFSGNGTAKDIQLSLTNLDATQPIVKVNGTVVTGFAYTASTGRISLTAAPTTGTNNVEVTAYKTYSDFPNRIKKCKFSTIYGGSNDTRVWVSGNPDMPDYVWRSGLYDPTYFPENGFYKYPGIVTGFSKQYDYLIVERENGKHQVQFSLNEGIVTFTSKPLNDSIGTIATNSIQLIENSPISLNQNGVYMLLSSTVRDERNVVHVSRNIDKLLLAESNLKNAVGVEHDKKYYLALNGNVYVLDYTLKELNTLGEWFVFNNIHASCFLSDGDELLFGDSRMGLVYRFKKRHELRPYNDDGQKIEAYWKSKYLTFGMDERRKIVYKVFYAMLPMSMASIDFYYKSDKKTSNLLKRTIVNILDFRNINFNQFSFLFTNFPQSRVVKVKAKKITHFQLIIENKVLDEGFGLSSLGVKYAIRNEVK